MRRLWVQITSMEGDKVTGVETVIPPQLIAEGVDRKVAAHFFRPEVPSVEEESSDGAVRSLKLVVPYHELTVFRVGEVEQQDDGYTYPAITVEDVLAGRRYPKNPVDGTKPKPF